MFAKGISKIRYFKKKAILKNFPLKGLMGKGLDQSLLKTG